MKTSFQKVVGIGLVSSASLLAGCNMQAYTLRAPDNQTANITAPAGTPVVTVAMKDGKTMTCLQKFNQQADATTDTSDLECLHSTALTALRTTMKAYDNAAPVSYTLHATDNTAVNVTAPANSVPVTLTLQNGKSMTCVQDLSSDFGVHADASKLICPVTKAETQQRIEKAQHKHSDDDTTATTMRTMMMSTSPMNGM